MVDVEVHNINKTILTGYNQAGRSKIWRPFAMNKNFHLMSNRSEDNELESP